MNRLCNVVLACALLIASAPISVLVALILRIRHGKPVLFTQVRVGQHNRPFVMHKFRTMRMGGGMLVTVSSDERVHATGKVLRASKLDELPQLWDVVTGRMNLVGPRPEVPEFVAIWPRDIARVVLSVKPGLTDPASVVYRHESDLLHNTADPYTTYIDDIMPRKLAMYMEYVQNRSAVGDLLVLWRTLKAVVSP